MSVDFVNMPVGVNTYGLPMQPSGAIAPNFSIQQPQMSIQQPQINPATLETPKIVSSGAKSFFSVIKEGETEAAPIVPVDLDIPDTEKEKRKTGGRRKKETGNNAIIRADQETSPAEVIDTPTSYSYMETNNLLHETLAQIDSLNSELAQEFNIVRHNRTMKNKYNTLIGLSENIGSLINNRVQVIKEINSTISKANEMDYKKEKDRRIANANVDDDKYIADLYKSFIQNPMSNPVAPQIPQVDPAIFGSGIVRADLNSNNTNNNGLNDLSYLNYMSNLNPEQNLMMYEGNPNVKQVVVFDAATGNKFFQMMDISNGNVIPNVPVYDQMFMEDTTLDLRTKIAKNINLNETFPIVVINENAAAAQY